MVRLPFARSAPLVRVVVAALAALATVAVAAPAHAQSGSAAPSAAPARPATPPAARPEDVASIDAILDVLYAVISGGAGEARDWDRMRSLFLPGARLIPTRPTPNGGAAARVMTLEEWIAGVEPFFKETGFHEREIGRRVERYGNVAHAFSAYESLHAPGEPAFQRGVNSIQLMKDGGRWWVVTIFWDAEREGNPVPEDLIGKP
ncbi:MAG TPA: hypothetical protein VFZ11_02255 [Gemmatimonadaceae bacterium]